MKNAWQKYSHKLYQEMLHLFSAVFGQLSWHPPLWISTLYTLFSHLLLPIKNTLYRFRRLISLVGILGLGAWVIAHFMPLHSAHRSEQLAALSPRRILANIEAHRTEIKTLQVTITPPAPTDIENNGTPQPMTFAFSGSAAPIALIGKEAQDIQMEPAHPGKWTWIDEKQLAFKPEKEWPIGTTYTIHFGEKTLAEHISLEKDHFEVNSPSLAISINDAQFYQDPVQVTQRRAVFTVHFSHPILPAEFEKHAELLYGTRSGTRFHVSYDKYKMNATLQSEPLAIPKESTAMMLHITAGIVAQQGGTASQEPDITRSVEIPGLYGLKVEKVETATITKEDGEPEHVLHIHSSMAIHEREIESKVSAWVLPPKADNQKWEATEDVTEAVLRQAQRLPLTLIQQEKESNDTHSFRFNAKDRSFLFVRVEKGLQSVGGYQSGEKSETITPVKAFTPVLTLVSQGSLLAINGDKKLSVLVRDLPGLKVEVGRILPHQLHLFATQSSGNFSKPDFHHGVTSDDLTERFERTIPLHTLSAGKSHYETLNFAEYLKTKTGERHGAFLLTLSGYDPHHAAHPTQRTESAPSSDEENTPSEGEGEQENTTIDPTAYKDHRLIMVTDLGFLVKKSLEGNREVFVQSISSGMPVAHATVEVWGKNGSVLNSYTTDEQGHTTIPNLEHYTREKKAVLLVIKKADDLSFMPLNRNDRELDVSRFDVGGLHSSSLPNQIQAYLFSDRGIYRPGDTMHIGIIAKSSNWEQSLKDLPVEAEIIDARGLVAKREKLKLGISGTAELSYTTFDSSPTGNYTIHLNLGGETSALQLGSTTVKVQEFMPDRMKISTHLSSETTEGWVHPRDLKAKVSVHNLFGTPAQHRRVESTLTLTPAYPAFPSYSDYTFFDPQRAKERHEEKLADTQTNEQGEAEMDLGLHRFEAATFQLHLLTKAFEPEGGRSVAAETLSLVSALPYLVGFKSQDDLSYVPRNSPRNISLIAINSSAKKTAAHKLILQRVERKVLSVLVKQGNGLYKYESRKRDVLLKESALELPLAGLKLPLTTDTPGSFAYIIKNSEGLELNRIEYTVAGQANVSRSLDRNAELQLSLNKKDYVAGEDIEVNIRAPYTGAGLITIERDKVYSYQWFKTDKTASVQKIKLPKDFEGGGYVMVHFVRDPASDEIYMSPLSYGAVPFITSLAKRTTPITLHATELVKPGKTIQIQLDSPQTVQAMVFAVDEGILQVAGYKNPAPLDFFFQKRALEVSTAQTLDLILPEFKKLMQSAAPGGDADGSRGKHLNPFKRKRDKPVVYWSGLVEVTGSKIFSYTVPEAFNGTLRVMAVVVNDQGTAAATTKTTVRGDLVLLPTVPVSLTPGDEVDIGVGIANNIKGSGKVPPITMRVEVSPHLEVIGLAQQNLPVPEKSEGTAHFHIRAKNGEHTQLGSGNVTFVASYRNSVARLSTDLSIRPASPFVTLVQSGRIRGNGEIASKAMLYPVFQRNEFSVSASPWGLASGLIQYLTAYPHGCTEQITSQTFPNVILSTQPSLAKELLAAASIRRKAGSIEDIPSPQKALERTISILRSRQTPEGAFGLYSNDAPHPFATVYAAHLLLEAKERHLIVPEDMFQRVLGYLQSYAGSQENSHHRYEWRTRSYATYLLTRKGMVTTALLSNLRSSLTEKDYATDIGAAYLAASYQMLKQDKIAHELMEPLWESLLTNLSSQKPRAYWWDYYYDPLVHDAQFMYLVTKHFPTYLRKLPTEAIDRMGNMIQDGYYHSLSSSQVILAFDAYNTALSKAATQGVSVSAIDRAGKVHPLNFPIPNPLAKAAIPLNTAKLKLGYNGGLPLYYSFSEAGYEQNLPTQAQFQGMEIIREFLDSKGQVVTEAHIGDELTARLRVRSLDKPSVAQVALVDLLPGGLEPVLNHPSDNKEETDMPLWRKRLGGNGSWHIEYADIREDRVIFYGDITHELSEVTYKVRVTNVGKFVIPPAWGEAMYDRKTFARSAGGHFTAKALEK